jgi:two-component system response regulator
LNKARAERPDLILLDLLMPKLPGLDVLRALKAEARTRAIPVLILSNSSREQDIAEVNKLGVAGYYVKADLSLKALGEHVARLLEN